MGKIWQSRLTPPQKKKKSHKTMRLTSVRCHTMTNLVRNWEMSHLFIVFLVHCTLSLGSSSYSKRGGQIDNRTTGEDSGRKGSSGSSTTKVPASPLVPTDRKKSATPSTVRQNTHTADILVTRLVIV